MSVTKPENVSHIICANCEKDTAPEKMVKDRKICCDCSNAKRREKYKNNEEHRKNLIKMATDFKHKKVIENQKKRQEKQQQIGFGNKQCRYCNVIKHVESFRYNRLKCRDCERDDPVEKFKRYIRTRIYNCLRNKNKTKHSVEYLGCSSSDYFKWIFNYNNSYNLENHGKEWHIDHIIPLSSFNLESEEEQLIAFNWRNTMPLSVKENLSKNNKIIISQVEAHIEKLIKYHLENKLDLPQVYIDLFAKHLVVREVP